MANEFQHKDPGVALTQAEYITTDGTGHIFDCQATGDILYASSATVLKNLDRGNANEILSMGASCIPAWTASPSVTDLTIGGGCITLSAATDIDLLDNNASALSFDASGKTGIIDIVTTDGSEGVTMSGTLGVTGILTANAGVVVDNFTLDGTELDLSTGDFALDVAGDIEVNADGGCINFKDASLALAAIVNTSCVGELRLHEAANYIGLKPPALSANQTWTWPATKGSACEVLTCDGCGVLSWEAAGGISGLGCTDNAIVRVHNNTTAQGSDVTIADTTGDVTLPAAGQFLAGTGGACNPGFAWRGDTNTGFFRPSSDKLGISIGCTERWRWDGSSMFLLDCANAKTTPGLTLQQEDNDGSLLAFKSSDVAHGLTDIAETDSYAHFGKAVSAAGGIMIDGMSEGSAPIVLRGTGWPNEAHNAAGEGLVQALGNKVCGTNGATACGNDNLFSAATSGATKFIVDATGDIFYEGSAAAFDTYCDAQLTRALATTMQAATCLPTQVVRNQWDDFVTYNEDTLLELGILGDRVTGDGPRGLVNLTQLQRLHNSAIWQLHTKWNDQQEEILALQGQLKALSEGK